MTTRTRRPLTDYLKMEYTFYVIADEDGGYFIKFPDLPGCMSQVETLDELVAVVNEIRELWIETEYQRGADIPEPTYAYA